MYIYISLEPGRYVVLLQLLHMCCPHLASVTYPFLVLRMTYDQL